MFWQKEAAAKNPVAQKEAVKDWILRYAELSSESSGGEEEAEDPVSGLRVCVLSVYFDLCIIAILSFCLWSTLRIMLFTVGRLVGLVVKASASGAEDPGFESRLLQDFSRSSHTRDLKIVTPVATLPGTWHYRSALRLVGPVSVYRCQICNFYLSVAAHKIVWADPSLRYTSMLLGH